MKPLVTAILVLAAAAPSSVAAQQSDTGITTRISVTPNHSGAAVARGNYPAISADGRYVAFHSTSAGFVSGDTNGESDVFLRDLQTQVTTRISVTASGR